jgi:hypothetical protein
MSETTTPAAEPAAPAPAPAAPAPAAAPPSPPTETLLTAPAADKPADPSAVPSAAASAEPGAGVKPGEADPAKPDGPAAVTYEPFELPAGINKDDPLLAVFSDEASKLGIPQAQAQALLASVGAKVAADKQAAADAAMRTWVDTNTQWQAEIKADKEIGGPNFDKTVKTISKLFDSYVGPWNTEARKALDQALLHTGAGNHPAIVKAFAKIAAAQTEGGYIAGTQQRTPTDIATLMYPSMSQPTGAAS